MFRLHVIGDLDDRQQAEVAAIIGTVISQHEWAASWADTPIYFTRPNRPFKRGETLIITITYRNCERIPTVTERGTLLEDAALQLHLRSNQFCANSAIVIEAKSIGPDVPGCNVKIAMSFGGGRRN